MTDHTQASDGPDLAAFCEAYVDFCISHLEADEVEASKELFCLDALDLPGRPYITRAEVSPALEQLCVFTRCAYVRKSESDPWREVGEFTVTLIRTTTETSFRCENSTRQVAGFHHPHVSAEGRMCTGQRDQVIHRIADGHCLEALDAIWLRLNTTNGVAYHGADSTHWPLAKEG